MATISITVQAGIGEVDNRLTYVISSIKAINQKIAELGITYQCSAETYKILQELFNSMLSDVNKGD